MIFFSIILIDNCININCFTHSYSNNNSKEKNIIRLIKVIVKILYFFNHLFIFSQKITKFFYISFNLFIVNLFIIGRGNLLIFSIKNYNNKKISIIDCIKRYDVLKNNICITIYL